jgi:hypothetical protein
MALIRIYQDTRGLGECRSCHAAIVWAEVVESGKKMPFDPPLHPVKTEGNPIHGDRIIETIDSSISRSHFASCPDAGKFRKRR